MQVPENQQLFIPSQGCGCIHQCL